MKKKMAFILILCFAVTLMGCGGKKDANIPVSRNYTGDTDWAVYWYLCGSDLESDYGAATDDLLEMMDVTLPKNVKIVIQTGGTSTWQNDMIDSSSIQRYVYDENGFNLIEEQPSSSMGATETLADFLTFAKKNYPAKHTMVTFWNHGGGSVAGASFDELYEMDSLRLDEMKNAFTTAYGKTEGNPPIDIIGFDTCLMATVDVAYTFSDIGKYLVASEELEPGNGWLYSGWIGAIAENPTIEPLELSKIICDTYVEGCEMEGTEENITLSVTNLSRVKDLIAAYEAFGKEALETAVKDPTFFAGFSRTANSTENYGGNTREQGFTNMTDLGHLARGTAELLPENSKNVLSALENCVEYKINGKYREEATGLACYYSYDGDIDNLKEYMEIGAGEAFKYLYSYGLTGELSEEGMKYISDMDYEILPELITLDSVDWENAAVTVDDDGFATLNLGPQAYDILSSVYYRLYYVDEEEDIMLSLGSDNDMTGDWENGIFKDNFRGVWGSIDGALCYMEIVYDCEEYNLYSVPILLNGEEYNLSIIYDFTTEKFTIDGARKSLDEYGAADKNMRYLVEGDEIQTIHYVSSASDENEDFIPVPIDTIIVTAETAFSEMDLGDGTFIMMYEMLDSQNNASYSEPITIEYVNGEFTISVEEPVEAANSGFSNGGGSNSVFYNGGGSNSGVFQ